MTTTRLCLVRHGETDWNVEGRWQGQADIPLNPKGIEQAIYIAKKFIDVDLKAIFSSDLGRASQTAIFLAVEKKLEVHSDSRLREIHMGSWQGMLISEIQVRYGEAFSKRQENPMQVAPPGGETALQVQTRVLSSLKEIIVKYPGDNVAIFSHGFAIATILAHVKQISIIQVWDLVPHNGEVKKLVINNLEI